jgi:NADH-quinone oxidoreductase subunit M
VAWLLALETAVLGTFLAADWSLFYMFWELTMLPVFFLIGAWGGRERERAGMTFFLYTLGGSVFMLVAMVSVSVAAHEKTFAMADLAAAGARLPLPVQLAALIGFFIAFAVKIPAFPLHGWLPPTYVEAPMPVTILLSALLSKMGAYGLLRLVPMFPDAFPLLQPFLLVAGTANVVYGALLALRQTDLKALVAYSSLSHMGFVLIGVSTGNASGFMGAALMMVCHGLIIGGLFVLVGLLEARTGTRDLRDLAGLSRPAPVFSLLFGLLLFGAIGTPGLGGFVAELLTMIGAYERWGGGALIAAGGTLIGVTCLLRTFGSMLLGPAPVRWWTLPDLRRSEVLLVVPLVGLLIGVGLMPNLLMSLLGSSVGTLSQGVSP